MSKLVIIAAIICYSLTMAFALETDAQHKYLREIEVVVDYSGTNLIELLNELEKSSDFKFAFAKKDLKGKQIEIRVGSWNMNELLKEISVQTKTSLRRINETITIKEARNSITPQVFEIAAINVSGKITDDEGEGLPGATIIEKGTSNGTVTDVDGNYSITVDETATLLVSFVGYESKEITVSNKSIIDVTLSLSVSSLEEVVVVGYGTQKKQDVTGAISSVRGEVLNEIPVASLEQSLSGRMSGVQVINGSGVPGSGATIRVRGVGTVNNNEPLYVIDGIILGNVAGGSQSSVSPLSLINPADIESIDVLKDASATAIYGARAGNGVVIITTKRGSNEKARISYETYSSYNVLDETKYNRLSGPEWAEITAKTNMLNGLSSYAGKPFVDRILAGERPREWDWVDELTRTGKIQSHNLSVTGGTERSNYFSSLSYFDQTGVIYGSDLERFTLRLNSDHKVGNRFKFGNTLLLSRSKSNRQSNVDPSNNANDYIKRVVGINPYKPIYGPDGYYAGIDDHDPDAEGIFDQANQHSIWAAKENQNIVTANRVWTSVYMDVEIIDGLTFHTMGSIDFNYVKREDRNTFNEIEGTMLTLPENTRLLFRNDEDMTWFIENTLTYNKSFGKHKITGLLGTQFQNSLSTWFSVVDGAFENTDYWFYDRPRVINEADPSIPIVFPTPDNDQEESGVNSYFGRLFYDYDGKYLLTATVRRDGSSKFGLDRRWGTFPAISIAWRISEEDFMPDLPWLTDLKVRGGYGVSGSDNVSNYQYAAGLGQGGAYSYSFNGGEVFGATLNRNANTVIQWEEIKMANIAMDASLLSGRLNFSADFYNKTTAGLFLQFQPALELGPESLPFGNIGEINNKGVDLSVNTINVRGKLTWTSDMVFSTVKNTVISLPEDADRFASDGWQDRFYNITRVGEEIGAIYGYEIDGIFQNWDEVYDHAYQDQAVTGFDTENRPIYDTNARDSVTMRTSTALGDFRFRDLNGDGFIDDENDRKIIGSTIPDFTWGLTNTLSYKGILLTVFFQGVHGVNVVNTLKGDYLTRERLDAWDGEGSSSDEPRLAGNGNGRTSSYRVEDASYIRLKNLRLGYSFPQGLISKIGVNEFQIYGTATNLLTFTDYTGYDPEVGLRSGGNNEEAGVDRGQYPYTRQFTAGVRVSF